MDRPYPPDGLTRLERSLAAVAVAAALLALAAWTYAGAHALVQPPATRTDPLAALSLGQFPEAPRAVRLLHWSLGKSASGLEKTGSLDAPTGPQALALLPDRRLLVSCSLAGVAVILAPAGGRAPEQIALGGNPSACRVTADGARAWFLIPDKGKAVVADLATRKVTAEATCGKAPDSLALSPDGSLLLVTNTGSDDVTAIDAGSARVLATVTVGPKPRGIAFHPTKPFAYVALSGTDQLAKLNWRKLKLEQTLPIGQGPRQIAMSADGETLYVALSRPTEIAKFDRDDGVVRGKCYLAKGSARMLLLAPNGQDLFVSQGDSGWVTLVDTASMSERATAKADILPDGLALTPDARTLYLANRGTSTIHTYRVRYPEPAK